MISEYTYIKVRPLVEGLKLLEQEHDGEWVDLRAAETVSMVPNEFRRIRLGISVVLPEGYEAHIAPRTTTFEKWGIIPTSSPYVVDNKFCDEYDEWTFPVIAMRNTKIHKNDRICQFKVVKSQPPVYVNYVDNKKRGVV